MKYYFRYNIDQYHILIAENREQIYAIHSCADSLTLNEYGEENESSLIREASEQLRFYFMGKQKTFTFPLKIMGTPFQQQVYSALLQIPYGETASYKEIAEKVNSPKAFRAVGNTVHKNPLWIVVPCHRIIGSNGTLVGYAGGLEMKQNLLELEKRYHI